MNYILFSVILLIVIIIIIYILSIDNNIDKFKNKIIELFTVAKSKKINYLNHKDNINILNYIKQQFISYDNITIPNKIYYHMVNNIYVMENIIIECYKMNSVEHSTYTINIIFTPFNKDNNISYHSILGLYGNYKFDIINSPKENVDKKAKKVKFSKPNIESDDIKSYDTKIDNPIQKNINNNDYNDIFDKIPDIIHLTEDDSDNITTDTATLISHNFK